MFVTHLVSIWPVHTNSSNFLISYDYRSGGLNSCLTLRIFLTQPFSFTVYFIVSTSPFSSLLPPLFPSCSLITLTIWVHQKHLFDFFAFTHCLFHTFTIYHQILHLLSHKSQFILSLIHFFIKKKSRFFSFEFLWRVK